MMHVCQQAAQPFLMSQRIATGLRECVFRYAFREVQSHPGGCGENLSMLDLLFLFMLLPQPAP